MKWLAFPYHKLVVFRLVDVRLVMALVHEIRKSLMEREESLTDVRLS